MSEEKETNDINTEAVFSYFDTNGSGTIDAEEFQDLAYAAGIPLDDASARQTFLNLSVSNADYLTLEEFQEFLSGRSEGSHTPVSRLLRARLLANQFGRSLRLATESSFWKEGDDRINSLSFGVRVGNMAASNTVPMEVKLSSRQADVALDRPKISLVLNIEDGVSDFTLGTAIGTLQTMFDAAVASSGGQLPVAIKVNDPVERKLKIDVVFSDDENKIPKGPPIDLNVPDVIHAFDVSLKFGQCFETLFGEDSKILVFGDSFSVDFSGKIEIVKKGLRLLKHIKMNMAQFPRRQKSFAMVLLESTLPFLFPLVLDVANIEFEFDDVTEFLSALSKNDRGLNVDKALLEWIRRIQGWHIATMLTLPPRTGLSREMPASAKKLYKTMTSTFSGLDTITLDMGSFNSTGVHGLAVDVIFRNFNPFRILPALECEHYGHQSGSYKQVCDEWFATFKDPVLRTWAAIVQQKPLPKDFLVSGAIANIMKSEDSDTLIHSLVALRDLALEGALVDQLELMKHVKEKRFQVGDAMWNKNVARSFGEVLQAVRSTEGRN